MKKYFREPHMKQKSLSYFIKKYQEQAPLFMSLIRPIEAVFFTAYARFFIQPVLDFGCGDGFFCETVFGRGKVKFGLDLETNKRTSIACRNRTYQKLILYDGVSIPLREHSIGTVISNCVLEHIPQVEKSVTEIHRILKPGGYFVTSVMTSRWNEFLLGKKILKEFYVNYMNKMQVHESLFSEKQWDAIFKRTGFEIVKKEGYLHKKNAQMLDLFHYISVPSLLLYMTFKRWVLFPGLFKLIHLDKIVESVISQPSSSEFAASFYVLRKKP